MSLKVLKYPVKQSQKIILKRGPDDPLEFVSSLEASGPKGLAITVPLHNQVPLELFPGEEVLIRIPTASFIVEVKSRVRSYTKENIILINLDPPVFISRIQRRTAYRLKMLLNIQIAPLPEKELEEPKFSPATALDISAGGMEVLATYHHAINDVVLVKFSMDIQKHAPYTICTKARVRRSVRESRTKHKLGLEFIDLSRAETDHIFRFIFKKSAEKEFWNK